MLVIDFYICGFCSIKCKLAFFCTRATILRLLIKLESIHDSFALFQVNWKNRKWYCNKINLIAVVYVNLTENFFCSNYGASYNQVFPWYFEFVNMTQLSYQVGGVPYSQVRLIIEQLRWFLSFKPSRSASVLSENSALLCRNVLIISAQAWMNFHFVISQFAFFSNMSDFKTIRKLIICANTP